MRTGPRRDLLAGFTAACREQGLWVGLYYSLMDWRHPDGLRCRADEAARARFVDGFTFGCMRELLSNYGTIDILWYGNAWPVMEGAGWRPAHRIRAARRQGGAAVVKRSRVLRGTNRPRRGLPRSRLKTMPSWRSAT